MIRTDLYEDELLLIRVLRLVKEGGTAYVAVDIRDEDDVLEHNYIAEFGFGFEYDMLDAQQFMAHLRKYHPGIINGKLMTYGDDASESII